MATLQQCAVGGRPPCHRNRQRHDYRAGLCSAAAPSVGAYATTRVLTKAEVAVPHHTEDDAHQVVVVDGGLKLHSQHVLDPHAGPAHANGVSHHALSVRHANGVAQPHVQRINGVYAGHAPHRASSAAASTVVLHPPTCEDIAGQSSACFHDTDARLQPPNHPPHCNGHASQPHAMHMLAPGLLVLPALHSAEPESAPNAEVLDAGPLHLLLAPSTLAPAPALHSSPEDKQSAALAARQPTPAQGPAANCSSEQAQAVAQQRQVDPFLDAASRSAGVASTSSSASNSTQTAAAADGHARKRHALTGRQAAAAGAGAQAAPRQAGAPAPVPAPASGRDEQGRVPATRGSAGKARIRWRKPLPPVRPPDVAACQLTVRVMRCTHWRELQQVFAAHMAQHRQQQQQMAALHPAADAAESSPAAAISGRPASSSSHPPQQQRQQQAHKQRRTQTGPQHQQQQPQQAPLALTPRNVAALLHRTSQLAHTAAQAPAEQRQLHSMVHALAAHAAALLQHPDMCAREVATIFSALTRLQHPLGKPFYITLMVRAQRMLRAGRFDGVGLATLITAVADCGMRGLRPDWAADFGHGVALAVRRMEPRSIALVLHALARLHAPPSAEALALLCARLQLCLEQGAPAEPQGSSAAPATAEGRAPGSGCALPGSQQPASSRNGAAAAISGQRPTDGAQQGPGAAHAAAARRGRRPKGLGWKAARRAANRLAAQPQRCCPADVSMSLWALGTLRLQPATPALLPAVERWSEVHMHDFSERELSNTAWALARLQHAPSQSWLQRLYAVLLPQLPELSPQALSTLLYSLAQMQARPQSEWLDWALYYAYQQLPAFTPQGLALTLHAMALMRHRPQDAWLQALQAQLDAHPGQMDARVLDKVREAYTLLGIRPPRAHVVGCASGSGGFQAHRDPQQRHQWDPAAAARGQGQAGPGKYAANGRPATAVHAEALDLDSDDDDDEEAAPLSLRGARAGTSSRRLERAADEVAVLVKPSRFG